MSTDTPTQDPAQDLENKSDYVNPPGAADVWEAIAIVQNRLPVIEKKGFNAFLNSNFTQFDEIAKRLYPMLNEVGCSVSQPLLDSGDASSALVKTVIRHRASKTEVESIHRISAEPWKGVTAQQASGASITYARRYTLLAALGIVCGEEDVDAGPTGPAQDATRPSPDAQQNQDPQEELERFKNWLKSFCPTKEDLIALCSWLAIDEMPGLEWQKAISQIEVARAMSRSLMRMKEQQGVEFEIIMANARDYYQKQQGNNAQKPY